MAKKKTVSFSLPVDYIEKISKEAAKRGLSRSSFLTLILSEYFSNKGGIGSECKLGRVKKKA